MRDYSLDTCLHLFETKFSDFFEEIKERSSNDKLRDIIDTKNNILSIHHFSSNKPLSEEHIRFRKLMAKRAEKIDKILNQSGSIALIYSQEQDVSPSNKEKMINFIKGFNKIYPNKKIYLIDVENANIDGIKQDIIFKQENLEIIRFTFLDMNESKHFSGNCKS
jgi:hypothetical protein